MGQQMHSAVARLVKCFQGYIAIQCNNVNLDAERVLNNVKPAVSGLMSIADPQGRFEATGGPPFIEEYVSRVDALCAAKFASAVVNTRALPLVREVLEEACGSFDCQDLWGIAQSEWQAEFVWAALIFLAMASTSLQRLVEALRGGDILASEALPEAPPDAAASGAASTARANSRASKNQAAGGGSAAGSASAAPASTVGEAARGLLKQLSDERLAEEVALLLASVQDGWTGGGPAFNPNIYNFPTYLGMFTYAGRYAYSLTRSMWSACGPVTVRTTAPTSAAGQAAGTAGAPSASAPTGGASAGARAGSGAAGQAAAPLIPPATAVKWLAGALEGSGVLNVLAGILMTLPPPPAAAALAAGARARERPPAPGMAEGFAELVVSVPENLAITLANTSSLVPLVIHAAMPAPPVRSGHATQGTRGAAPEPQANAHARRLAQVLLTSNTQRLQRCLLERFVRDHGGGGSGGTGSSAARGVTGGGWQSWPLFDTFQFTFHLAVRATGGASGTSASAAGGNPGAAAASGAASGTQQLCNMLHMDMLMPALAAWDVLERLGLVGNVNSRASARQQSQAASTAVPDDWPPQPVPAPSPQDILDSTCRAMTALRRAYDVGRAAAPPLSYIRYTGLDVLAQRLVISILGRLPQERVRPCLPAGLGAIASAMAVVVDDVTEAVASPDPAGAAHLRRLAVAGLDCGLLGAPAAAAAGPMQLTLGDRLQALSRLARDGEKLAWAEGRGIPALGATQRVELTPLLLRSRWLRTLTYSLRLLAALDAGADEAEAMSLLQLALRLPSPLELLLQADSTAGADAAAAAAALPSVDETAHDLSALLVTHSKLLSHKASRLEALWRELEPRVTSAAQQQAAASTGAGGGGGGSSAGLPTWRQELNDAYCRTEGPATIMNNWIMSAMAALASAGDSGAGSSSGGGDGAIVGLSAATAAELRGAAAHAMCAAVRALPPLLRAAPHIEIPGRETVTGSALAVLLFACGRLASPLTDSMAPSYSLRAARPERMVAEAGRLLEYLVALPPGCPAAVAAAFPITRRGPVRFGEAAVQVLGAVLALACHPIHTRDVRACLARGGAAGTERPGEGAAAAVADQAGASGRAVEELAEGVAAVRRVLAAERCSVELRMLDTLCTAACTHGGGGGSAAAADADGEAAFRGVAQRLLGEWRQRAEPEFRHGLGPLRLPRACANPRCEVFGGAAEAELRLRQCTGCRAVRYCGPECQRQHWREEHKEECRKAG